MVKAYQMKITLERTEPPIWRRCIVPAGTTFENLKHIFAGVMGWEDYHMANFEFPDLKISVEQCVNDVGEPMEIYPPYETALDARITIIDPLMEKCKWFRYNYDFGDDWVHKVTIEKRREDYEKNYPQVTAYQGDCPMEDCGGIYGYYDKKQILEDPDGPQYSDIYEWCDGEIEVPYDIESVNKFLERYESFFVTGEKLEEVLKCFHTDRLLSVAKKLNIRGYLQLSKEELPGFLVEKIVDPRVAKKYFLAAAPEEWAAFVKLNREIKGNVYQAAPGELESLDHIEYWLAGSYIFLSSMERVLIPNEVKECFSKVCTDTFLKKYERTHLLTGYVNAAANLYGIVSKEKVVEIFNSQNEVPTAEKELEQAVKLLKKRGDLFKVCSTDQYYAPDIYKFGVVERDYEELLQAQEGKPYYIPEKSEFLKYVDEEYFEKTKQYEKFRKHLQSRLHTEEEVLDEICVDVMLDLKQGDSVSSVMGYLMEWKALIGSRESFQEMADLLIKLSTHTRMVENRGYTQAEISQMSNRQDKVIPFGKSKKIYPNDPCLCGSGKKYKYCCGKKDR